MVFNDTGYSIKTTTGKLTYGNRFDHILARLGYKRSKHCVEPGLYALVSSQLSRVGYSRDNFILASSVVNC
ncbi:MAG: hypothetical protein SCH70_11650, partial [Candidatus Methanoperedens sp.]|nr:hypothetical protein [Candidatus Methanoperedens sp.]